MRRWLGRFGTNPNPAFNPEGTLEESRLPVSVVSSSAYIDLCTAYGATPGKDIIKPITEALEKAIAEGKTAIRLRISKAGEYLAEGVVHEGEVFGYKYAGQILLPARTVSEGRLVIEIEGPTPACRPNFLSPGEPSSHTTGVVIQSTATNGELIDIIPSYESSKTNLPLSNLQVKYTNLTVRAPQNPTGGGLNMWCARIGQANGVSVEVTPATEGEPTYPTGTRAGITFPHMENDGMIRSTDNYVYGFPVGIVCSEHMKFENTLVQFCAVGADVYAKGGHVVDLGSLHIEKCTVPLRAKATENGGGNIVGLIDVENPGSGESSPFFAKFMVEDPGDNFIGQLRMKNLSKTNFGLQVIGGHKLDLSRAEMPVGCKATYPYDKFRRTYDIAGHPGATDESSHVYTVVEGEMVTVTEAEKGAMRMVGGKTAVVTLFYNKRSVSRQIRTVWALRASGAYAPDIIIEEVVSGTNAGNMLWLKLEGGKLELSKVIKGTKTSLATGGTITNGKTYEISAEVLHKGMAGAPNEIVVWVNGEEAFKYALLTVDREALLDGQFTSIQDGIRIPVGDEETKITEFQVLLL